MSDRGSILISTANDIGEALVEKLGGEGYAPSVWDKEYNKLGIADVDAAPALSVLENSSETGTARGSILMSTANAVGAMLNKKYNTDRGFKPKEWASAGRKMKPLETDTKSGSIVNIQGAKETPLLSLVGTIDPTIEGTSEVSAVKLGKNLCANNLSTESVSGVDITIGTDGTITLDGKATARITRSLCTNFFLKKGTYVLSCGTPNLPVSCYLNLNGGGLSKSCTANTASISFTLSEDATIIYIRIDLANGSEFDNFKLYPMLEVGSSVSAYEPYKTPTTYTAELGRTVYGGTADIVNGVGVDENGNDFTFDGQEISTSGDVENYYTSAGDTSIEYYAVPTAYTRGTASGAIANVQSARTDLPFTKVKANIAPSIAGTDEVEVYKCGVNLFDKTTITPNTWIIVNSTDTESAVGYLTSDYIPVKANTKYYVSTKSSNRSAYYDRNKNGIAYFSFSGGASFTALYDGYIRITINNNIDLDTFIVNEGDTEATYDQYNKTTYTADLEETVYGGSVDLVSGEVVKDCTKDSMSSSYLSGLSPETYIGYEAQTAYFNYHPSIWVRNWNYLTAAARTAGGIKCDCNEFPASMNNTTIFASQYRIYFDVNGKNITSVQDFIDYVEDLEQNGKSLDIAYEVATPTESSITPQVIVPSEGVNNLWNNAGGDTDVEYFTTE